MTKKMRVMSIVLVLLLVLSASFASAMTVEMGKSTTVSDVLDKAKGERVTLMLSSGEKLTGKVASLGQHMVVIAELSGREYYNAVVKITDISAIEYRSKQ